MAINSGKLLNRPSELHRRYAGRLAMKQSLQQKMVATTKTITISKKDLSSIEERVVTIKSLLGSTYFTKVKETERIRKNTEKNKRAEQEKEIEKKETKQEGKQNKIPSVPKLGIIDRIKNFFVNMLLGYVAVRMLPQVKKLPGIITGIAYATEFVTDFFIGLVDGLGTFLKIGYDAYDATRGFIKTLGGEDAAKKFDDFTGVVDKLIETAIFVALATADQGGDGGGPGGGRGGRGSEFRDPRRGFKGNQGWNLSWERATNPSRGFSHLNADRDIMKRYFQRYGRDAFIERFGQEGLEKLPKAMARSGLTKFARRGLVSALGKGGAKNLLKIARPFLKRIPIPVVGALIDFGLSWALGEDPGRAAFKAIGAGILGSVGMALGGGIGLAGGPLAFVGAAVGGLAGGALGDMAGGAIYDAFFGGKKPQSKPTQGRAEGGEITRGGKKVGGRPQRKLKKQPVKRSLSTRKIEIKPGQSIGGEEKIKRLFPEANLGEKVDGKTPASPLGFLKDAHDKVSMVPGVGGILSLYDKAKLGQEPTGKDYENAAGGLSSWVQRTISTGVMRGIAGFAEGGSASDGDFSMNQDNTSVIAKKLEEDLSPTFDNIRSMLDEQLNLAPNYGTRKESDEQQGPVEAGDMGDDSGYSTNAGDYKELLDMISSRESAGAGYNAYNEGGAANGYKVLGYGGDSRTGPLRRALTSMTVKEIMAHQKNVNPPIHAAGRYQIIGSTMDGLINRKSYGETGVSMNDKFDAETQDKLGIALIKYRLRTGANPDNFISEWRGLKFVNRQKLQAAISKAQRGKMYPVTDDLNQMATGPGGYKVTRSGATITNFSQLPPHHDYQRSSDGRGALVQDFTLYKGNKFLNIPVPSPVTGEVTFAGPAGGGGNWVEIMSSSGKVELGHFNRISVRKGQKVQAFRTSLGSQGYSGNISPAGPDGTHVHMQAKDSVVARYINTLAGGARKLFVGGRVNNPTFALLGERGPEFVFDADTTRGLDSMAPLLLDRLNKAKRKKELASVLRYYTQYESGGDRIVTVERKVREIVQTPPQIIGGRGTGLGGRGGSHDPRYDSLYRT